MLRRELNMSDIRRQRLHPMIAITLSQLLLTSGCTGLGIVGVTCGDLGALLCGSGLYCKYEDGSCGENGAFGVCAPKPEACALIFAPVCGCDGNTYGNACEAAGNGVSIDFNGPCETDGLKPICGGIAGFVCSEGDFCKFADGNCGSGDQSGDCMPTPDFCTEEFAPVCGCDGVTYGNECESERSGVSILSRAECANGDDDQQICGGIAGVPCDEGEFCQTNEGECCCDIQGVCRPIPEVCTLESAPVCGCDGVTYGNQCEADRAGVSIESTGDCPTGE